jgi:hypothetical protein
MRLIEPHFSLDCSYALIFMQLVHIMPSAVMKEMGKERFARSGLCQVPMHLGSTEIFI